MNNDNIRRNNARGTRWLSRLALAMVAALPVACGGGSGIEGRYDGVGNDPLLESITLGSGGVASVVYPLGFGTSGQGSYVINGNTIMVTAPSGDQADFDIDPNGCLSHFLLGTFCRGGGGGGGGGSSGGTFFGAGAGTAATAPAAGGTERYEATTSEGVIALELMPSGTARMTMTPFGGGGSGTPQRMTFDLSYQRSGDGVTVEMPGEGSTPMTRSGRDLLMTQNGETARFIRQ